ncbi:restriction endonuclease [Streptosporangium sp. 'caverna']|uniref:restriction endonuclease n=1 Tax=Streptosporangium sp. 'caverna' TaxID=2202249 RepID=UPI000D7E8BEE|nr:restriction endonuclease [Streptosporangium sp. 'caverna']AWS42556.1 hypothetical protein DKM19_15535 [Streptosporangium sp. 'caverna']
MRGTPSWRQYQHDVADLLTELGFDTQVEEKIASRRGTTHAVDVSARRTVAGVCVLWVVECKLWRSRVGKEKVAALIAICEDLGADRGLLMSETGFQSGALQMATGRSITLTNLEDLRANAAADLLAARQRQAERRLLDLEAKLREWHPKPLFEGAEFLLIIYLLAPEENKNSFTMEPDATFFDTDQEFTGMVNQLSGITPSEKRLPKGAMARFMKERWKSGADEKEVARLAKIVSECRALLDRGALGHWPVILNDQEGKRRAAWRMEHLLGLIELWLTDLEQQANAQSERVKAAHPRDTIASRIRAGGPQPAARPFVPEFDT